MRLPALRVAFGFFAMGLCSNGYALPVFGEQTNEKCGACHINVGELTPRGRKFKLLAYAEGKATTPFAAIATGSVTKIKDTSSSIDPEVSMPKNGKLIPEGASVLMTGRFADGVGGKVKWTADVANTSPIYGTQGVQTGSKVGKDFFLDASEVRVAKQSSVWGKSLVYGASLNNAPGQEDLWVTTPVNSFPYKSSQLINAWGMGQFGPTTLIDGGLTSQTIGLNLFGLIDDHWYFSLGNYWKLSTDQSSISVAGPSNRINASKNPYFRIAYSVADERRSWMTGLFGMQTTLARDPLVVGSASGVYNDIGVDVEYQHITDTHTWSAQAVLIHEATDWGSHSIGRSHDGPIAHLTTVKTKASYNYARKYTGSLFGFKSKGDQDNLYWAYNSDPTVVTGACNQSQSQLAFCSQNGKPDTSGFGYELMYNPIPPLTVALQKTYYTKFLGGSSFIDNSSGNLRSAKDNNLTYLYMMYAY
jgi:hypothetical protein